MAEVVTQLPVPSRLGMMRFERMNEANWLLLFIDASCEKQFGIPPSGLCNLVETPYASLMEPEARYRLHDSIQQQLAENSHYLVRYTLHTPQGALKLMELGEPFKQRGRALLRGYLLVTSDEPASSMQPSAALEDLQRSQAELLQHQSRALAQQQLIVRLASQRYQGTDPCREAAELITRSACEIYSLARAGIWHINGDPLEPVALYVQEQGHHEMPSPIDGRRYPGYLRALKEGRALDAHDAENDPRTCELFDDYLRPKAVTAMLDASIRVGGELVAVLLGLLVPGLLGYCVVRGVGRRAVFAIATVLVGVAVTALSSALSYGPSHAWEWLNLPTRIGIWAALAAALALVALPRRACAALLLLALALHLNLLNQAPTSAYFAQTLQAWEQGRFIRFFGLGQWLGWLWPYAALAYVVLRVSSRDREAPPAASGTAPGAVQGPS